MFPDALLNASKDVKAARAARAARAGAALFLAVLLAGVFVACASPQQTSSEDPSGASTREDPVRAYAFSRPREVIVEGKHLAAALVTFQSTPDHLAVLYAVAGEAKLAAVPPVASLVNDKGEVYVNLSNIAVGAPEGVLVGMIVTEPYRPGGAALTLRLNRVTDESGWLVEDALELPVATNPRPDETTVSDQGGRYGDDAGIRVGDAMVGVAGPPGTSDTHVLVQRGNHAEAVHVVIEPGGIARVVSEDQSGFKPPLPPGFPWPAGVPYKGLPADF